MRNELIVAIVMFLIDDHGAAHVLQRQVHLFVSVAEEAQDGNAVGNLVGLGCRVGVRHAQQHQIATPDGRDLFAVDRHRGGRHALYPGFHA